MRGVVVVLAAIAVLAGGWYALSRPNGEAPPVDPPEKQTVAQETDEVVPDDGDSRTTTTPPTDAVHIQGTVQRAGAPIAGVRVEVRKASEGGPERDSASRSFAMSDLLDLFEGPLTLGEVLHSAESGADGKFDIAGLVPGRYHVAAIGTDDERASTIAPAPSRALLLDLPVGTCRLEGRVLLADGTPVQCLVAPLSQDERAPQPGAADLHAAAWQSTSADGSFRFGGLAAGPMRVLAVPAEGRFSMSAVVTLPREDAFVFRLPPTDGVVQGHTVEAGSGDKVPGARIVAMMLGDTEGAGRQFVRTSSAQDGSFELPGGRFALVVAGAPGFAPTSLQGPPPDEPLVLALVRRGTISGQVLRDEDGSPLGDVPVYARTKNKRSGFSAPERTESAADGSYALDAVGPGETSVHALGNGWASLGLAAAGAGGFDPNAVSVEPAGRHSLDLRVEPTGTIDVLVTDASGAPLPDARVRSRLTQSAVFAPPGPLPTDAEGRARFVDLVPTAVYAFEVEHADHTPFHSRETSVGTGGTETVACRLAPARSVRIRVVGAASGTPIEGARIESRTGSPTAVATTDARGDALLGPLPPGAETVDVTAPAHGARNAITLPREGASEPFVVQLTRGLVLAGRVIGPAGMPLAGATVSISRDFEHDIVRGIEVSGAMMRARHRRCGADGRFRVDDLLPGRFEVTAVAQWNGLRYTASAVSEPGREDLELRLEPADRPQPGQLIVRVVDEDGQRVPGADLMHLHRSDASRGTSSTNLRNGEARLSFQPGDGCEHWLIVTAPRDAAERPLPLGGTIIDIARHTEPEIEIALAAERTIEGRVTDGTGAGVRGVLVLAHLRHEAFGSKRADHSESWSDTRTQADGTFRIGRLGDGDYRLSLEVPPAFAPADPVAATAGDRGVAISLRAGARARVTVLDDQGEPLAGASVTARIGKDRSVKRRTDSRGVATLEGLAPDALHSLDIRPPRDRQDHWFPHTQKDWPPADLTVQLERALWIEGTVRDAAGKAIPRAMVLRQNEAGTGWSGSGADEQGRFRITGLRAADVVRLCVDSPFDMDNGPAPSADVSDKSHWTEVRAGDHDVVLTLRAR